MTERWLTTADVLERTRWSRVTLWRRVHDGRFPAPIENGRWLRGGVTIDGWTWVGFDTEEAMQRFESRWPSPATGG